MKNLKISSVDPFKYFFNYYVNDEIRGFGSCILNETINFAKFNIIYTRNGKDSYELQYYTRIGNLEKYSDIEKYIKSLIKLHLNKLSVECVEVLFRED